MYIDRETLKRVNIDYEYKGFSRLDTEEIRERAGVIWIDDPIAPQEAQEHPDWYFKTEVDISPYTIWTRREVTSIYDLEKAKAIASRQAEYKNYTDGLFFKEQRGEVAAGTWLKEVEAIKEKYPYPAEVVNENISVVP